jgi:hypothetical protein
MKIFKFFSLLIHLSLLVEIFKNFVQRHALHLFGQIFETSSLISSQILYGLAASHTGT